MDSNILFIIDYSFLNFFFIIYLKYLFIFDYIIEQLKSYLEYEKNKDNYC